MCIPKSNSNDRYAITCNVIAYHLVHFVSIRLINKCQSSIDFIFTSERAIYSSFMKISVTSPVFRGKNTKMTVKLCKVYTLECQQGDEICLRNNKIRQFDTLESRGATIRQKAYCDILRYGKPVLQYILRYTWYLYFCLLLPHSSVL